MDVVLSIVGVAAAVVGVLAAVWIFYSYGAVLVEFLHRVLVRKR